MPFLGTSCSYAKRLVYLIPIYLLLQYFTISDKIYNTNFALPVKSFTSKFFFFTAFSSNSGTVTVLVLAHRSIKAGGWECSLVTESGHEAGLVLLESLGLKNHLSPDTGVWRLTCQPLGQTKTPHHVDRVLITNSKLGKKIIDISVEAFTQKEKMSLGLCLAGPLWGDDSDRSGPTDLISFVEFYLSLGVEGITVYTLPQGGKMQRVIDYYRSLGILTQVKWSWPKNLNSQLGYNGQQMLLQDCLLRNRDSFTYLAYSDLDERLLPSQHSSLLPLLHMLDSNTTSAFGFTNVFYPSGWKYDRKSLGSRYTGRERLPDMREDTQGFRETRDWEYGKRSRYIVKPLLVDSLQVHYVNRNVPGHEVTVVPRQLGCLAHFRTGPPPRVTFTGPREEDSHLGSLVPAVVDRVEAVCKELQICRYVDIRH